MKVLEVFGEPISNGGQESFVINTIQHMNRADMQVDLLTPYYCDNDHYRAIVKAWNGKIFELKMKFEPGKSRRTLFTTVRKFLKENQYDVVHIHSGSISVLMYVSLAAKQVGVSKIIVHSHCAGERTTLKHNLVKALAAPVLMFCPTEYCACSTEAGKFKFTSRIVREKMHLVNNGVDLDAFRYSSIKEQDMRKRLGISKETRVIGHVGRFSQEKNHSFLLSVYDAFHKRNPDSILLLIGSGELMPDVRVQARKLKLDSSVRFIGNVSNVADYLQVMDAFVLPSKYEGLPIVMVEAQAAGVPVIASDAITKEAVLVDQVQLLSLSASMEEWTNAVARAVKISRYDESAQIFKKGFDIDSVASKILTLYRA